MQEILNGHAKPNGQQKSTRSSLINEPGEQLKRSKKFCSNGNGHSGKSSSPTDMVKRINKNDQVFDVCRSSNLFHHNSCNLCQ